VNEASFLPSLQRNRRFMSDQSIHDTLQPVRVEVEVVLGHTYMPVHQLLRMGRGAVIELEAKEDSDVLVNANGMPIARAAVQVEGGKISVALTRMLRNIKGMEA
jgi:flagellar motor switch protein FliN